MNKREFVTAFALARPFYDTEDTVGAAVRLYDAIVAATTDEGWIEHRGEKPYPEGDVEYITRDGRTFVGVSDFLIWSHDGTDPGSEIVKWRPL